MRNMNCVSAAAVPGVWEQLVSEPWRVDQQAAPQGERIYSIQCRTCTV